MRGVAERANTGTGEEADGRTVQVTRQPPSQEVKTHPRPGPAGFSISLATWGRKASS